MTWPPSISCLSSVVENEENLFERFDKNAPQFKPSVNNRRLGIRVVEIGKAESAPSVIVRNPTVSRFAFRVSRFAFRVSRFAFRVSRFAFRVSRFASCLPNCQSRLFLRNKTTISVESTVGVILDKTTKVTRTGVAFYTSEPFS
jgi:hypothetical protein